MSTDPLIGKQFGSYTLQELIGRGGMAAVYRGYQAAIDRSVAIKVMPAELLATSQFTTRFANEARTLGKLTHPNILPLYDFGQANGMPYIVMPLMAGGTLADRLKAGPLPLAETVRIITAVAQALDFANRQGILHRDIKPNNILFDQQNNPYLGDFGIAKAAESNTNLTGTGILGTPDFMSPEQARGDTLDPRSDQYSLAVVAYQCLTGTVVFRATTPMGVIFKHVSEAPQPPRQLAPGLPSAVDRAVLKALAKAPGDRFASVGEFARALAQAAAPAGPAGAPTAQPTQARPDAGQPAAAASSVSLPAGAAAGPSSAAAPAAKPNRWLLGAGTAVLVVACCGLSALGFLWAASGGSTPASGTATPAAEAVFQDSFTDSSKNWNPLDDGKIARQVAGGAYVFRSAKATWLTWDNPGINVSDVRIEVTARSTGAEDAAFGLICNYKDSQNYYSAGISHDGYYAIVRRRLDKVTVLTDPGGNQWRKSDAIPPLAQDYRLALECAQGELALYVGDTQIAQVQDKTFSQGDIGLFLTTFDKPDGQVSFDDLVVRPK